MKTNLFALGTIWAYPTDTSYGLGVRCDDLSGLENLKQLKQRSSEKYFSLMVRDMPMLHKYAYVPENVTFEDFQKSPLTLILKPRKALPETAFWPKDKVAFRVCLNLDIAKCIEVPVTATSANLSGKDAIYSVADLQNQFMNNIQIYDTPGDLPRVPASSIWDYTEPVPKKIR